MARSLRLIGIFVLSLGLGVLALVATTYLPADAIDHNIQRGMPTMQREGILPARHWVFNTFVGDNFNDAVMLSLAYLDPDATPLDTLAGAFYGGGIWDSVDALDNQVTYNLETDAWYQRYWQGYLVVLRPVLLLFDYPAIRVINSIGLGLLLAWGLAAVWRRLGRGAAVALSVAAFLCAPPIVVKNIQFVTVFYLALAGLIVAMRLSRHLPAKRFDLELFLGLGIATAYFDMLTAPIVTLGIPLAALAAVEIVERRGGWATVWTGVRSALAWGVGYVGFWATKWAIVALTFPEDLKISVSEDLGHRFGAKYGLVERVLTIGKNVANLVPNTRTLEQPLAVTVDRALILRIAVTIAGVVLALVFAWLVLRLRTNQPTNPFRGSNPITSSAWIVLLAGLLPYLWYIVVGNHSDLHNYFTFRGQAVTAFAVGLFLWLSIDWKAWRSRD